MPIGNVNVVMAVAGRQFRGGSDQFQFGLTKVKGYLSPNSTTLAEPVSGHSHQMYWSPRISEPYRRRPSASLPTG